MECFFLILLKTYRDYMIAHMYPNQNINIVVNTAPYKKEFCGENAVQLEILILKGEEEIASGDFIYIEDCYIDNLNLNCLYIKMTMVAEKWRRLGISKHVHVFLAIYLKLHYFNTFSKDLAIVLNDVANFDRFGNYKQFTKLESFWALCPDPYFDEPKTEEDIKKYKHNSMSDNFDDNRIRHMWDTSHCYFKEKNMVSKMTSILQNINIQTSLSNIDTFYQLIHTYNPSLIQDLKYLRGLSHQEQEKLKSDMGRYTQGRGYALSERGQPMDMATVEDSAMDTTSHYGGKQKSRISRNKKRQKRHSKLSKRTRRRKNTGNRKKKSSRLNSKKRRSIKKY